MSLLIVQIYKLHQKQKQVLHIVLQVNQSEIFHWNPREKTVWHPSVVRGAMYSGKTWRSALWLNALHSGKK